MYLPWAIVGMDILTGTNPFHALLGIVAGHFYYYLEFVHPVTTGQRYLQTPHFMCVLPPPCDGLLTTLELASRCSRRARPRPDSPSGRSASPWAARQRRSDRPATTGAKGVALMAEDSYLARR
jgi:hypothetical protein